MSKCNFTINTEALILAAQEQALATRAIERDIYHTRTDGKCRLCKQYDETIHHVIAGCSTLAATSYTERHNQVALVIHRGICKKYGLPVPEEWYQLPESVVENERVKVLWDFSIQTDKQVIANKPDIVIRDKETKKITIIDIAVPFDTNIKSKEIEKVTKYQPLREELARIWGGHGQVVPVVIGALGAITPKLEEWLAQIPGEYNCVALQKCALISTCKILRRTLRLPGLW